MATANTLKSARIALESANKGSNLLTRMTAAEDVAKACQAKVTETENAIRQLTRRLVSEKAELAADLKVAEEIRKLVEARLKTA